MKKVLMAVVVAAFGAYGAQGVNLLANPGFEESVGADNWSTRWGTFGVETWNVPPEGTSAAYIKGAWGGGEDKGGCIQALPVTPDVEYFVKASFYTDNGWTAAAKAFKLEFFDEAGQLLKAFTDDLQGLKDGQWMERSLRALAPGNAVLAQVVIEASGIGGEGVLGVDNVTLEEFPKSRR